MDISEGTLAAPNEETIEEVPETQPTEESVPELQHVRPSSSSTLRKKGNKRKLYDQDIYTTPESLRNFMKEKEEVERRMLRRKEYLLELQIKDMEFRVKEAEISLKIAEKKLDKENNS